MDKGPGLQGGEVVQGLPSLGKIGIFPAPLLAASPNSAWSSFSGHQVFTKVGEAFEFLLVDLLHNCFIHKREYRLFPGKVLVKIIDISFGFNSRFEGRLDLLLLQEHPVDLLEERVLLDGILTVLRRHTAQALVGVLGHESL